MTKTKLINVSGKSSNIDTKRIHKSFTDIFHLLCVISTCQLKRGPICHGRVQGARENTEPLDICLS